MAGAAAVRQTAPADLVLTNGTIITVDARDSVAQALAVTGGRIVFVGSSDGVKRFVGERTEVIDLRGRTATPGLIDTHVHFSESADALDLGDARNMDDVIAKVRARAEKLQPGEWLRGGGWDEGKLAERRYITAAAPAIARTPKKRAICRMLKLSSFCLLPFAFCLFAVSLLL